MRVLSGIPIKIENAVVERVSRAPLLVKEEVGTAIDIIVQDAKHGRVFLSIRSAWANNVEVGNKISAELIAQKRGVEGNTLFFSKIAKKVKVNV